MPRRFQLVVFDWDGTLIDSVARILIVFRKSFEQLGLVYPDELEIKKRIGLPLAQSFRDLAPGLAEERVPECIETYRRFWLDKRIALSPLFEGVHDLLRDLTDAGYQLVIATGKSRVGLERELGHYGLAHFFRHTRCAQETAPKPDPEMLFQLMDVCNVGPDETVMIGDTCLDLDMARNAGVAGVGVTSGGQDKPRLLGSRPIACFDRVVEVRTLL